MWGGSFSIAGSEKGGRRGGGERVVHPSLPLHIPNHEGFYDATI